MWKFLSYVLIMTFVLLALFVVSVVGRAFCMFLGLSVIVVSMFLLYLEIKRGVENVKNRTNLRK